MRNVIAISAAAMILAGCSAEWETAAAENGVAEFREQMASGRYRDIYSAAAQDFRQGASEATALRFLEHVADTLGPVRESSRQGWRVTTGPSGSMVVLGYTTEFARGRGTEEFVFRVSSGTAKLAGYHINSMDLMMLPAETRTPRAERATDNATVAITPVRR